MWIYLESAGHGETIAIAGHETLAVSETLSSELSKRSNSEVSINGSVRKRKGILSESANEPDIYLMTGTK